MGPLRRTIYSVILAGILSLALAAPAFAGGWAVVTLDAVPQGVRPGQQLSLGFMVRQHGVTPIDTAFGGPVMKPILTARNLATGETLQAEARKEGPVGHFVVEVAFPSVGDWRWAIEPGPFAPTDLGTLSVAAVAAAPEPASGERAGIPAPAPAIIRDGLRWAGIALLVVALGLALWGQRAALTGRRALRGR